MPLDLTLLRTTAEGGDTDLVQQWQIKRGKSPMEAITLTEHAATLDAKRRQLLSTLSEKRRDRTSLQKEIGSNRKQKKDDCGVTSLTEKMKSLYQHIPILESDLSEVECNLEVAIRLLGNYVDEAPFVCCNDCETNTSKVDAADLLDPLWCMGGYEQLPKGTVFNSPASTGLASLTGVGVYLARSLVDYATDYFSSSNNNNLECKLAHPPSYLDVDGIAGMIGGNANDLRARATTDVIPIPSFIGISMLHQDKAIPERMLPMYYCAISSNSNNGTYGLYSRGNENSKKRKLNANTDIFSLARGDSKRKSRDIPVYAHSVERVDIFVLTTSDIDESRFIQDDLTHRAMSFYRSMNIKCRCKVVDPTSLANCESRRIEIQGYMPISGEYIPLGFACNYTDYISRELRSRCGAKQMDNTVKYYVHTVCLTLYCMDSLLSCLVESNSSTDGFNMPIALQPFMCGDSDSYHYPFIRKKYRGKNGKISIKEACLSKANKKNYMPPTKKDSAEIIKEHPNQGTCCFGEMLPTMPTREDIIAELSSSDFAFVAPTS